MRKGKLILGIVIIALSCGIYLYPFREKARMSQEMERIADMYEESGADTEKKDTCPELSETGEELPCEDLYQEMKRYNERLLSGGQNLIDAWSYAQNPIDMAYMPSSDDVIGYITAPDMNVELPLLIGASTEHMARGAAVLGGTSMPVGGENTNCVIAAHRGYRGMAYFRDIENLSVGSSVYITNPWGTLEYIVTGTKIINPDDDTSIKIQEGKDMITLLTCHPYMSHGKYRYLVYCERAKTVEGQIARTDMGPEIGENVDEEELEEEKDISELLILLEDAVRVALPAAGALMLTVYTVRRKAAKGIIKI